MTITLIHHIRKIVLALSLVIAITTYIYTENSYGATDLAKVRLGQYYALIAVSYLYFALLASPLYSIFPKLPFKPIYIRARRAIGVSAFFFASLHAFIEFFFLLGGFNGLSLLPFSYLKAITYGFTAYLILTLMASTSFDWAVKKLGVRWKMLHRFVYLAAFLIVIHALTLGTHFTDLSELIPKVFFVALAVLLVLEAIRLDRFLAQRFGLNFTFGVSLVAVAAGLAYSSLYLKPPTQGSASSLGFHTNHVEIAKDIQNQANNSLPNLPGLTGDRSKRFTLDVSFPSNISPNQQTELRFRVYDASSGLPVRVFQKPYVESFHLIIVNDALDYYNHLHPKQSGNEFVINTSFPKAGIYHLYSDFQPLGAIDQQIATSLTVGNPTTTSNSLSPDKTFTKKQGGYEVTMSFDKPLSAAAMSVGNQKITFDIKTAEGTPVSDLKPYLGAFGHLVMINSVTYDYLHVHPNVIRTPQAGENSGPTIEFLPIGIYGAFKPGIYKAFLQFNHAGEVRLMEFVVNVEK